MSIISRMRMKLSKQRQQKLASKQSQNSPTLAIPIQASAIANESMRMFCRGEIGSYVCNDGFEHSMDARQVNMTVRCLLCSDSRTWEYAPTIFSREQGCYVSDERNAIEHILWEQQHRINCKAILI